MQIVQGYLSELDGDPDEPNRSNAVIEEQTECWRTRAETEMWNWLSELKGDPSIKVRD